MYSKTVTRENLDKAQNEINRRETAKQFSIKLYSVEESRAYVAHLDSLIIKDDRTGKIEIDKSKRPNGFLQDEINFMENERIVCKHHFSYYMTHYHHIKTPVGDEAQASTEGKVFLYKFRKGERVILKYLSILEAARAAIYILFLKARQLGCSTFSEALILHRTTFYKNINALVGSSDPTKTRKMAGMMTLAWSRLPYWLIPEIQILNTGELLCRIPKMENKVYLEHGTAKSGIGRGDTPDIFHLSEIPDFSDPYEDIDAALIRAVHANPSTLGILESTAKGDEGYWYDKWHYAYNNWRKGRSRFCPIFLGWFLGEDLYPTPTWLAERQYFFQNWTPKPDTIAHALKVNRYVQNDSILASILGKDYKLSLEQQFFYETDKQEFTEMGQEAKFLEEMPATPDEAFQNSSGSPVFPLPLIQSMQALAKPLASYQGKPAVFGIIGDEIPKHFEPEPFEIDRTRQPIPIISDLQYGKVINKYFLIPLIHVHELWNRRLFIYEFPFVNNKANTAYAYGIDCAGGVFQDNTVLEVIKKGTLTIPSEQVAEFASADMSADDFLPITLAIGSFYSFYSHDLTNQARAVIELQYGGANLQHRLQVQGWTNFHMWEGIMDKLKRVKATSIGWATNQHTRPILVGEVRHDLMNGFLRIHSPFLIDECKTLVDSGGGRIEHKAGCHDDRYFGAAMAHYSLSAWDVKKRSELTISLDAYSRIPQSMDRVEQLSTLYQRQLNNNSDIADWQKPTYEGRDYRLYTPDEVDSFGEPKANASAAAGNLLQQGNSNRDRELIERMLEDGRIIK